MFEGEARSLAEYTSPNMTKEEAERLLQDVAYNISLTSAIKGSETAQKLKYEDTYGISNAIGNLIIPLIGGIKVAWGNRIRIWMPAAEQMKGQLIDRFIDETGGIEGYTQEQQKTRQRDGNSIWRILRA